MAGNLITFKNVSFGYNSSAPVLQHCTFDVQQGNRVVLKGESGSGKTTIFRLLLGYEMPDEGHILFNNHPLSDETIHNLRTQTAWLPQDLDLGSDQVKTVIQFPFTFEQNKAKATYKKRISAWVEQLGLSSVLLDSQFSDLSTGQRQRVGIAICLLLDKPFILLDEPTSALDLASKEKVAKLLFSQPDTTILSTSHDPWWIEQCDKKFELQMS